MGGGGCVGAGVGGWVGIGRVGRMTLVLVGITGGGGGGWVRVTVGLGVEVEVAVGETVGAGVGVSVMSGQIPGPIRPVLYRKRISANARPWSSAASGMTSSDPFRSNQPPTSWRVGRTASGSEPRLTFRA